MRITHCRPPPLPTHPPTAHTAHLPFPAHSCTCTIVPTVAHLPEDEDLLNAISDALAACSGLMATSGKVAHCCRCLPAVPVLPVAATAHCRNAVWGASPHTLLQTIPSSRASCARRSLPAAPVQPRLARWQLGARRRQRQQKAEPSLLPFYEASQHCCIAGCRCARLATAAPL